MTEHIEILSEERAESRFASPKEILIAMLVAYVFCLFSSTGPIITPEILLKSLTLFFLYLAGRNSQNALSGILAASICAAYPQFHVFNGFSNELVSLVSIAAIVSSLSFKQDDNDDYPPVRVGASLVAGLVAPISGISWMPLFVVAAVFIVIRSPQKSAKIANSVLFVLGLAIAYAFTRNSGSEALFSLTLYSLAPLTLASFFESWYLPLSALLLLSLASAFFLSKDLSSKPDQLDTRKRDITQSTLLLIAAILGAFISKSNSALLIIVPFSLTIGITISSGITLFKKRFRSHLGHIAVPLILIWAIVPKEIFETDPATATNDQSSELPIVFTEGMHNPESWGFWVTDEAKGEINLDPLKTPYAINLSIRSALGSQRLAELRLDDSLIWSSNIDGTTSKHTIKLEGVSGVHQLSLSTPDGCVRPSDIGDSTDNRCLAFGIETFSLKRLRYQPGTPIRFNVDALRPSQNEFGFSTAESWGVWTEGEKSGLTLELGERPKGNLKLEAEGHFHVFEHSPALVVRFLVNEVEVDKRSIEFGAHINPEWVIPSHLVRENGQLNITWAFENPVSPKELGMGDDTRKLALALTSITLSEE